MSTKQEAIGPAKEGPWRRARIHTTTGSRTKSEAGHLRPPYSTCIRRISSVSATPGAAEHRRDPRQSCTLHTTTRSSPQPRRRQIRTTTPCGATSGQWGVSRPLQQSLRAAATGIRPLLRAMQRSALLLQLEGDPLRQRGEARLPAKFERTTCTTTTTQRTYRLALCRL